MKITKSKLNVLAQKSDLLTRLLKPSFHQESRDLVDEDYPRDSEEHLDVCRVLIVIKDLDGEDDVVSSQLYPEGLDSNIPVDQVLQSIEESTEFESYEIDEVVTKCVDALGSLLGQIEKSDQRQFAFFSTLLSGLCMTAFRNPLDILIVIKPTNRDRASMSIDWLWYRPR